MGSISTPRESSKLFSPLRLGEMNLEHRVIMSPMTRLRLIQGGGYYNAPGMFAPEHLSMNTPGGCKVPKDTAKPTASQDIRDTIDDHVHAAKCAIEAGFDCVEIVASGNGYLLDQFLNSNVKLRTDACEGTKENRARFTLEVLDAVIAAIGASRVSIRMSPWGTVWVPLDADPIANYRYVLSEVEKRGVAYVCLTQPRADLLLEEKTKWENMYTAIRLGKVAATVEDLHLKHFQEVLKTTPILASGNYDGENCFEEVERGEMDAITFGRWFISNPDLVEKLRLGKRLTKWNPATVYASAVVVESEGYTDYPFGEVEDEEAE
ncbi:Flavin oxidoreductase hxnT, partial [Colletotrichum shisoi]